MAAQQHEGFDLNTITNAISDFEAILNVILPLLSKITGGGSGTGPFGATAPGEAGEKLAAIRTAVQQHTGS